MDLGPQCRSLQYIPKTLVCPLLQFPEVFATLIAHVPLSRGTSADVILLLYYASPLSTFGNVIRTKDSSTIYLPLAITAAANGSMWTAYGAVRATSLDVYVYQSMYQASSQYHYCVSV